MSPSKWTGVVGYREAERMTNANPPDDGFGAALATIRLRPLLRRVRTWSSLGHITYVGGGRWGVGVSADDVEFVVTPGKFFERGRWYCVARSTHGDALAAVDRLGIRHPSDGELVTFLKGSVRAIRGRGLSRK